MAHRSASGISEPQLREILRLFLRGAALLHRERNQTCLREIAELARGRIAHELRNVLADAGDAPDVRLLHIKEQRAGYRVCAVGDRVELWGNTVDVRALHLVG